MAERFAISELLATVSIPRNTLFAVSQDVGLSTADTFRLSAYQVFDYVLTDIKPLSARWSSVYTTVRTFSANWMSSYMSVSALSADWSSVYTTVKTFSANWGSTYLTVSALSASWDSVYTTVSSNSAAWENVVTNVRNNSGDWESYLYLTVDNNSQNGYRFDPVFTTAGVYANTTVVSVQTDYIRPLTGFVIIPRDVTGGRFLVTGGGGAGGRGYSTGCGGGGGAGGTAIKNLSLTGGEVFFYYCGYGGQGGALTNIASGCNGEWSYIGQLNDTDITELSTYQGFSITPPTSALTIIALASGGIGGMSDSIDIGFGLYAGIGGAGGVASIGSSLYSGASGFGARAVGGVGEHGGSGGASYWGPGGVGQIISTATYNISAINPGSGGGGGNRSGNFVRGSGKGGRVMVWLT